MFTRRPSLSENPQVTIDPPPPGWLRHWAPLWLALIAFSWLYLHLAGALVSQTNLDMHKQDQKHNMKQALLTRPLIHPDFSTGLTEGVKHWLPHMTDGVVGPLWPWISAHFASPDHRITEWEQVSQEDEWFFQKGKWVNVGITLGFLVLLTLVAGRFFRLSAALNLLLLGGLGALLPRAVYFQPEPVYFILFFLCWVVAMALLNANPLRLYLAFGLLCGLAWLAKTSIQPLMAGWFGVMAFRFIGPVLPGFLKCQSGRWSPRNHVIGCLIWALAFMLTAAPRLSYAHEKWGRPFFAYPNVWMWMDEFDGEGFKWMVEHPDKASLDAVPKADMPSAGKYFRTHTRDEAWQRLRDGFWDKNAEFLAPKRATRTDKGPKPWRQLLEWRGAFLGGLLALLGVTALLARRRKKPAKDEENAPPATVVSFDRASIRPSALITQRPSAQVLPVALFVVGTFLLHGILYGFYTPIGRGERFMLSLYLPLVFTLLWGAESFLRRAERSGGGKTARRVHMAGQLVILAVLLWRVGELLRHPVFHPSVQ